jgi:hypothetical protein
MNRISQAAILALLLRWPVAQALQPASQRQAAAHDILARETLGSESHTARLAKEQGECTTLRPVFQTVADLALAHGTVCQKKQAELTVFDGPSFLSPDPSGLSFGRAPPFVLSH